jgi:hypothetical protein
LASKSELISRIHLSCKPITQAIIDKGIIQVQERRVLFATLAVEAYKIHSRRPDERIAFRRSGAA